MKRIKLLEVIIIALFISPVSAPYSYGQSISVKVRIENETKSILTDEYCAAIPGATITFKNKKLMMQVTSDEEGSYKVEIPAGYYRVTAQAPSTFKNRWKTLGVRRDEKYGLHIILHYHGVESTSDRCVNEKNELVNPTLSLR